MYFPKGEKRGVSMATVNVSDLNSAARVEPRASIIFAERDYHEKIEDLAQLLINKESVRAVLLAGPSGSGKTTTANLLCDALKRRGEDALVLSLDDFYLDHDDPRYPLGKDGKPDYERPESLNLKDLEDTLRDIIENREFNVPKYDFKTGRRCDNKTHAPMGRGCVIIEGLHALNPKISENLPHDKILKLFVSVSTNVNKGGVRIISGRKIRFVRRLVRDSIFRAADAKRTLSMWKNVLHSEDLYLYPYKADADVAFDTFHSFELGVMKREAVRLLNVDDTENDEYARIVLSALKEVEEIDSALVPKNSLIREFISGGIYDKHYK